MKKQTSFSLDLIITQRELPEEWMIQTFLIYRK